MANEIQFPYTQNGLTTLQAYLYQSGSAVAGASSIGPIAMSDTTSAGVYWGSVPTSPSPAAGAYSIVVKDGANVVGGGTLQWNGTEEIKAADLALQTTSTAIKAKTDSLTFTTTNMVDANVQYVNDLQVKGTGTPANPWNPA
jgi:hypothetical protein